MNHEKLNNLLGRLEESVTEDELFHFLMVSLGEKPGGLVMDPPRQAIGELEEVMNELEIEYVKVGDDRSFLDRLLRREDPFSTVGFFFTKDESRFKILKESEGEFYGFSNDAVGEFLGYPEKSVTYYGSSGEIGSETIKEIKNDYPDADLKYLALVGYIPAPKQDQVKKAVEKGKRRSELLDKLGEELLRGKQLKNELIADSHWD